MSYHTPTGWAERATMLDRRAAHQIRLATDGHGSSGPIILGCSCHWNGGAVTTAEDAIERYRVHKNLARLDPRRQLGAAVISAFRDIPLDAGVRVVKGAAS
jgi:hypothetical protein